MMLTRDESVQCCLRCAFFAKMENDNKGLCKRNPPTVYIMPSDDQPRTAQVWPVLLEDDICGQFQPDRETMQKIALKQALAQGGFGSIVTGAN